MATQEEPTQTSDAALARKHRIAMRNRQRAASSTSSDEETKCDATSNKRRRVALEEEPVSVPSSSVSDASTTSKASPDQIVESMRKKKPHITGIKKQSRYDPGVEMTKEELKAWRKEARRVRNRESAAASRKKNREAIDGLETQLRESKSKYDAALQYILTLEKQLRQFGSSSSSSSFGPSDVLRKDLEGVRKSSLPDVHAGIPIGSPELPREGNEKQGRRDWPVEVRNDPDDNARSHILSRHYPNHSTIPNSQMHIIDNTIIRPIAAKISPGANEKMKSVQNDVDGCLPKSSGTPSEIDMIVSDDDATALKKTSTFSSPSSTDNSSYSGSDDETIIESDQPLFLDANPPVSQEPESSTIKADPLLGCDGADEGHDVAVMAEFLEDTFQAQRAYKYSSHEQPSSLSATTFGDVLSASEMDALLDDAEADALVLLPGIYLES